MADFAVVRQGRSDRELHRARHIAAALRTFSVTPPERIHGEAQLVFLS